MEKQNNWHYSKDATINHPVSQHYNSSLEKIDTINKQEGGSKSLFTEEIAIMLDKIEKFNKIKKGGDAQKTMDMAYCVNLSKLINIVLLDYRLNYKNVNNLSKSEIDQKIYHSKNLLSNHNPIYPTYYFIFGKS